MGLFDRFSPFATERRQLEELRESVNFTESLIAHQMAVATGTFSRTPHRLPPSNSPQGDGAGLWRLPKSNRSGRAHC